MLKRVLLVLFTLGLCITLNLFGINGFETVMITYLTIYLIWPLLKSANQHKSA